MNKEGQTLEKYRLAITTRFPTLVVNELEYIAEGWDSLACLVNGDLIFRFPKRPDVARTLQTEIRVLPELAPTLPVAIPDFTYLADPPGPAFPYPFVGYQRLEGLAQEDWSPTEREAHWWRPLLGNFLTALHAFPVQRARELGVRDYCPADQLTAAPTWRETLEDFYTLVRAEVYPLLSVERQDELADYFEDFVDDDRCFKFEPVLIHADLWDDHILMDSDRQRLSIIDFGDLAIGDPALDVSELMLPYYGGQTDETFGQRRRFYGRLLPLIAILFGQNHSDSVLIEYGLANLGQDFSGFP